MIYRGYSVDKNRQGVWQWIDEKGFVHSGFATDTGAMDAIDRHNREKLQTKVDAHSAFGKAQKPDDKFEAIARKNGFSRGPDGFYDGHFRTDDAEVLCEVHNLT